MQTSEEKLFPQTFSLDELNDLIRKLNISKEKAEHLHQDLNKKFAPKKCLGVSLLKLKLRVDIIFYSRRSSLLCLWYFKILSQNYNIVSKW